MDDKKLRDLVGTPLNIEPQRRFGRWLAAAALLSAVAVIGLALMGDSEPDTELAAVAPTSSVTSTTSAAPSPSPPPRVFHEMAYHPSAQRIAMFGGSEITAQGGSGELLGETWLFDPAQSTWTDLTAEVGPSGRIGHAFAYDGSSELVVLFGGGNTPRICGVSGPCATDPLGDTWVLEVESGLWTERLPATAPSARYGASMAYDAESGALVLFGGAVRSGSSFVNLPSSDTWLYDTATNTWTELRPEVSPPARAWHDMVYDPDSDRILMFGGGAPGLVDDLVWSFDANTTTWESLAGTGPSPRWGAAVAFDAQSGRLVVAGGHGPVVRTIGEAGTATEIRFLDDMWVFDPRLDEWEPRRLLDGAAYWISAAWDPVSDRSVTFVFGATGTYDVEAGSWEWEQPAPESG